MDSPKDSNSTYKIKASADEQVLYGAGGSGGLDVLFLGCLKSVSNTSCCPTLLFSFAFVDLFLSHVNNVKGEISDCVFKSLACNQESFCLDLCDLEDSGLLTADTGIHFLSSASKCLLFRPVFVSGKTVNLSVVLQLVRLCKNTVIIQKFVHSVQSSSVCGSFFCFLCLICQQSKGKIIFYVLKQVIQKLQIHELLGMSFSSYQVKI